MQSTSVTKINDAILEQAMTGTKQVYIIVNGAGRVRIVKASKRNGVLKAKSINGNWYEVEYVTID